MSEFKWSDELRIGVELFDKQHKKWIELAAEVKKIMGEGEEELASITEAIAREEKQKKLLDEAFTEFLLYSRKHLREEEKQMKKYNFPGYEKHRKEHNKYRNLIQKIRRTYKKDQNKGTEKLIQFLEEWLLKHIKQTDKKYANYLPSKLQGQ